MPMSRPKHRALSITARPKISRPLKRHRERVPWRKVLSNAVKFPFPRFLGGAASLVFFPFEESLTRDNLAEPSMFTYSKGGHVQVRGVAGPK